MKVTCYLGTDFDTVEFSEADILCQDSALLVELKDGHPSLVKDRVERIYEVVKPEGEEQEERKPYSVHPVDMRITVALSKKFPTLAKPILTWVESNRHYVTTMRLFAKLVQNGVLGHERLKPFQRWLKRFQGECTRRVGNNYAWREKMVEWLERMASFDWHNYSAAWIDEQTQHTELTRLMQTIFEEHLLLEEHSAWLMDPKKYRRALEDWDQTLKRKCKKTVELLKPEKVESTPKETK